MVFVSVRYKVGSLSEVKLTEAEYKTQAFNHNFRRSCDKPFFAFTVLTNYTLQFCWVWKVG